MSELSHKAEVVPVVLEKHPNGDNLSLVHVHSGYQVVVRTQDWLGVDQGVYVCPDSLVNTLRPEFSFLNADARPDGKARIKARKLRGVVSFGLLVPAPDGAKVGDDVTIPYEVEHYQPPEESDEVHGIKLGSGEACFGPNVFTVKYDIENFRKYASQVFTPGEPTFVCEKLDGENSRFVFHDGQMYCGSRTNWKRQYPTREHVTLDNLVRQGVPEDKAKEIVERIHSGPSLKNKWWAVLEKTPELEQFCREHPGMVVYGELYGGVGGFGYGSPGNLRFAAFDVLHGGRWVDAVESRLMLENAGVPCVPLLNSRVDSDIQPIPYDLNKLCEMAEGFTLVKGAPPDHIREGVVVKSWKERHEYNIGRAQLKIVSFAYLSKKGKS